MVTELLIPKKELWTPKPPGYVKLDLAFGVGAGTTLFDKSRYRSHGTISGASWATGLHGYALDFNAATPDYVEIPATQTQIDFTSEDFSFVIRLKPDDLSNIPIVYHKGEINKGGILMGIWTTGYFIIYTYQVGASQNTYSSAGDIVVGTWYTVGISRSGAAITLYVDGVDVTSVSGTHVDPVTATKSAKIGVLDDKASQPFDGQYEFFKIFGGIALTASEHLAWHNALA